MTDNEYVRTPEAWALVLLASHFKDRYGHRPRVLVVPEAFLERLEGDLTERESSMFHRLQTVRTHSENTLVASHERDDERLAIEAKRLKGTYGPEVLMDRDALAKMPSMQNVEIAWGALGISHLTPEEAAERRRQLAERRAKREAAAASESAQSSHP